MLAEVDSDRFVVTCENHTIVGGLFATVATAPAQAGFARRIVPWAVPDKFLATGALPTLHDRYGHRDHGYPAARERTQTSRPHQRRRQPPRTHHSPSWGCMAGDVRRTTAPPR